MNDKIDEFILEHWGVKGMKWGIRKDRSRVKVSSDYKKTRHLRNRKTQQLTNKQLKDINSRINLEQNYRRLNPTKVQLGASTAKGILAGLTTAASLYTLANSPAGKAGIAFMKQILAKK